ncbi:MAG: hypothetical protein C0469_08840 [Cyanobacteria bacterium DS2.3.42]|nr:hypothetical protein [Cyanobacteria bacterium DS2.3.42]
MSVLDTNFDSSFDSAREMPSRATWLDNASANLLNDNSYFSGASRRDAPSWLGNVEFFDSGKRVAVAAEDAPQEETPPVPETPPVGETPPVPEAPHPSETPPVEPVLEAQPEAPAEPVGPRAVAGPRTDGGVFQGESLPGNGPPEHTTSTPVALSRNDAANKADAHNATADDQPAGQYVYEGPGQDGKNSDGTYGAGHHQYAPPTYYPDSAEPGMTEHNRPAVAPEETAPVHTPQKITAAAHQALWAAIQRYKATGQTGQTGTPGEGPGVATVDPGYQPGPPGSFGGLRGRRGG